MEGGPGATATQSAAVTAREGTSLRLADEPFSPAPAARSARSRRSILGRLQSVVTVALFMAAVLLGLILFGLANPPIPSSPFPAAATVAEPASAARLTQALSHEDAGTLAETVDGRILQTLDESLAPIVHVTEVRFLGAVALGSDTVVAYLARGKDAQGQKIVRGFALHVQEDRVVGVN